MKYIHIDSFSKIPLYQQIADQIEKAILNGDLKHGDKLPSESYYDKIYSISPIVVKHAYQILKDKQLIETKKGSRAFVFSEERIQLDFHIYSDYNEKILKDKAILLAQIKRPIAFPEIIDFGHQTYPIVETKRLFLINTCQIYFQINQLIIKNKIKSKIDYVFNKGILSLFQDLNQESLDDHEIIYYPQKASSELSQLLEIPLGSPVHFLKYLHYVNKKIAAISYHYFPADKIQLRRED